LAMVLMYRTMVSPLRFQRQKLNGDPDRLVMQGSLAHNAGKRN
jgi:hypothetical protein